MLNFAHVSSKTKKKLSFSCIPLSMLERKKCQIRGIEKCASFIKVGLAFCRVWDSVIFHALCVFFEKRLNFLFVSRHFVIIISCRYHVALNVFFWRIGSRPASLLFLYVVVALQEVDLVKGDVCSRAQFLLSCS
jgi:hypothetical protein